jgi:signal transduction histidine kinase
MSHGFQTFCIGAAAVIDVALLLSVLERRNWRQAPLPIVALILGAGLFHGGEFANLLLTAAEGDWAEVARWIAMSVMSGGLLLMPSSMLHGIARIWQTGFDLNPAPRRIYLAAYAPMLILPLAMTSLATHSGQPFLDRLVAYVSPYTAIVCAVNSAAIAVFLHHRKQSESRELNRFLAGMSPVLAGLTALLIYSFWIADTVWLASDSPLMITVIMSPLVPALLFAYFVIRYRFMRLIVERTFVYGAILAAALLFHRLVVQDVNEQLGERFRIDFGILEGVVVLLLVLFYQPIRQRVAEALHYLMGRSPVDVRQRTRELAVEMWQHVNDNPQATVDWFVAAVEQSWNVKFAVAWLFDDDGKPFVCSHRANEHRDEHIEELRRSLRSHSHVSVYNSDATNRDAVEILKQLNGSLTVRVDHEGVSGLLLLGRPRGAGELSQEETNSVLLLVELLAVTLHNHYLQDQRVQAERRAAQNEKLSMLGLLTSCITHEIKNPLSSIKTIATVLSEQLGPDHENSEDISLILEEVERLSVTTSQFLKFTRPTADPNNLTDLESVIRGAVHVLSHFAKQRGVTVTLDIERDLPPLSAGENSAREIVFNLLLNSLEAVGPDGRVEIGAHRNEKHVVTTLTDDGPGIPAEMEDRMFEPFITTKSSGTGLGLYIARRNIEELGGEITCQSEPNRGTRFSVKLPYSTE